MLTSRANIEVERGGLAAFFHNSTGTHAKEIVDALIELGAMEEAAAINQARELLRTRSLEELSKSGQLERLTDKFLASSPGLFARLSKFIEERRDELEAAARQCDATDARNERA
jgi:hypothetical protein